MAYTVDEISFARRHLARFVAGWRNRMRRLLAVVIAAVLLVALGALVVLALPNPNSTLAAVAPVAVATVPSAQEEAAAPKALQSTTGFAWIALPLDVFPDGSTAADLANHVETNSGGAVTVQTVSKWNAAAQSYDIYYHQFAFGDFPISNQAAYRVETTGTASAMWSQVGEVPEVGSYSFMLLETATTDFNWIMYPLDRGTTNMASDFAADIEANASGSVTIRTISRWNAPAQSYDIYYHQFSFGDFGVLPGYPYRVEPDVASGSSVTWQ